MRAQSHISIARSKVREGELTRHTGAKLDGGKVFIVVSGLGLPRTWALSLPAVISGFEKGLAEALGQPRAQRASGGWAGVQPFGEAIEAHG